MARELWLFLPVGYLFTIAIETPVLMVGLSSRHSIRRRLFAGIWLTACTYPIVVLVLPLLLEETSRWLYLLVAEIFAPVVECALFAFAFGLRDENGRVTALQDFSVIVLANVCSFVAGEILISWQWFGLFDRIASV